MPSPCHASLCLRQALLLKATPSLPASVHRRCMPRLCFAVAPRRTALRHRSCSLPVLAELPNASAYRFVAGPSRSRSFPCPSFANRPYAVPSPSRRTALLFPPRARHRNAYPSPSKSKRFLRRVSQRISFAALGLAGLLRRRAARRHAPLFHRLPEQIKALPLQRPSPQRHRAARPSHANPLPPTSSRCRRISLKASLRCSVAPPHNASHGSSVAHHRNAPLSRRYSGSEPSVHSKRPLPLLRHWPMPRNWP